MYKLAPFNTGLMRIILHPFPFGKAKNEYSIWKFCSPQQIYKGFSGLQFCSLCSPVLFPCVFWLVLVLSVVGVACTLNQMLKLWVCQECKLRMWRSREYHVFAAEILRRTRMMGCCIKLTAWFSLIVGILTVHPQMLRPWILLNSVVIVGEIINWVYEVMSGHIQLELHSILSLIMPCLYILMVKCVQEVFEKSLKYGVEASVRVI